MPNISIQRALISYVENMLVMQPFIFNFHKFMPIYFLKKICIFVRSDSTKPSAISYQQKKGAGSFLAGSRFT
jgi:phosphatidylglycerophosphatase A